MTAYLRLRLGSLLLLWALCFAVGVISPVTLAYDQRGLTTTAVYDGSLESVIDYDAVGRSATREKRSWTTGDSVLFTEFARLVAAERGLLSTTSGGAMESGLFQRIQTGFQRNGGIMQADAESTRFLLTRGAEGATIDSSTILLRQNPSTSAVYEELIHSAQLRRGMTDVTRMEIEAAEKLIRFRQGYGIPNAETRQTIERLRQLRGGQ